MVECYPDVLSIRMLNMDFFLSERICEMTRMVQFCVYFFSGITSRLGPKKVRAKVRRNNRTHASTLLIRT